MVSTLEQMQVRNGTGPGVRRSKRPLFKMHRSDRNNLSFVLKTVYFEVLLDFVILIRYIM